MERLKFTLILLMLIQVVSGGGAQINSEPDIVQSDNAKLRLTATLNKRLPGGGFIRVYFPPDDITVS